MNKDTVKENRHKFIGGSDIPIIMEISDFKKRFDLLLEKAELQDNDFEGNQYTDYGNELEPIIRNQINESLYTKNPFKEDVLIKDHFRGNFDGKNSDAILEIKTTSQMYNDVDDYKVYLVQLLFYMQLAEKEKGVLAVYSRPEDFSTEFDEKRLQIFMVSIDNYKDLLEEINTAIEKFIVDLNKLKENPFLTEEELLPMDITSIANQVVALENQLAEMKAIETKCKELKEQLNDEMVKANIKKWETPNGTKITRVEAGQDEEIEIENLDSEKFEEENKELIETYEAKRKEYITIEEQIKKGRKGYVRITLPKDK